jgi:hypothetical protein
LRGQKVRCRTCGQVYAVDAAVVPDEPPAEVSRPAPAAPEPPLAALVESITLPVPVRPSRAPLVAVAGGLLVLLAGAGVAGYAVSSLGRRVVTAPPVVAPTLPDDPDDIDFGSEGQNVAPLPGGLPVPVSMGSTGAALAGPVLLREGLRVTPVGLAADRLAAPLCWDAAGEHFYALERSGLLHRVRFGDLRETHQLRIGRACSGLAMSRLGPVVALPELGEVWLIGPDDLTVVGRIAVSGARYVASFPGTEYAVIGTAEGNQVLKAHLGRRAWVKVTLGPGDPGVPPALAPGPYNRLFNVSSPRLGDITLQHIGLVRGRRMVVEGGGVPLGPGRAAGICTSPDGEFVCVPMIGGGEGLTRTETPVYRADDLTRPVFALPAGIGAAVAFDPAAGEVYAPDRDHLLVRFDPTGRRLHGYGFPGRRETGGDVRQLLPHPAGRSLLMVTTDRVERIDIEGP